ncbi:ATP-dependent Clp protease ATP-binding subunit ClpA homolog CD4A, chloroplastic-like [Telopea speciosissima]|uniref:ATP-dependent Clp protease ATP-binding subunit ClpA homolog CD4A, chloroplastic-like n=1 Tax=Telopea speciosissima TaxID=54955 RepID=UPI001CC45479|nr:ATP-dependent Clp protease ATP-binding subunit ClpA homolog CD4A, chloroplastic-like [Telopea speciosissima]
MASLARSASVSGEEIREEDNRRPFELFLEDTDLGLEFTPLSPRPRAPNITQPVYTGFLSAPFLTSNVGSSVIEKGGRRIGFDLDYDEKDSSYNRIKSLVTEELKQYFRPEFLNRLDEMIVFRQLTKLEVKEIADIMLKEVFVRLKVKDIELQVTERFRDRVVEEGYDPSYGARPLRRAIMRLLEDSMAEKMLAGEIKEGNSVIVDVDSDGKVTVLNGSSGAPEPAIPL